MIPLFLYFGPVGFNAYSYINNEIGVEDLGTDQAVLTFTSLTDDVVFIIDGGDQLMSEALYNWTAQFAFELQNNEIVEDYAVDGTPIEHVFTQSQQLLSQYYLSIRDAIGFFNVTGYIVIEGTNQFITFWKAADGSNTTEELAEEFLPGLVEKVQDLKFGQIPIFEDVSSFWIHQVAHELQNRSKIETNYGDIVESWTQNPSTWSQNISSSYKSDFQEILSKLNSSIAWTRADIFNLASDFLFGEITTESLDFIDQIFDPQVTPGRPVELAQDMLIPFLRAEDLPYGFPETIRDFYLSAFTDYDGTNPPESMIVRYSLRSDLTQDELEAVFLEMERIMNEIREDPPFGIEIGLLSFLNYQRERSEAISSEMHSVDLIAILIGVIILYLILRDLMQSIIIIGIAWGTTQVTRGIFIHLIPILGDVNGTSFSIVTTFLLGAAMNYTVFFKFRYFQERTNEKDHDEAIETSSNTALHSVVISGIAIVLSMLPYNTSSLEILNHIAKGLVWMMIIQIILLVHVLPVFFSSLDFIEDRLKNDNFNNMPTFSFNLNLARVKQILVGSIILGFISLFIIGSLNSTFVANDIVGETGETGNAIQLLEKNYPQDYLSKYLVSLTINQPIRIDGEFNTGIIEEIDQLTQSLASMDRMKHALSLAWPLGSSFNYSDTSIGQVTYRSVEIIVNQLIYQNNQTFIILQSSISSNSGDLADQSVLVDNILQSFIRSSSTITNGKISGLPAEIAELTNRVAGELPGQITIALILLTIFLTVVLKSVFNPLRLEFTIILATIYSIAIASLFYTFVNNIPLNIIVISSSFLILLGLGTDFDIYLFRRIVEEKEKRGIDFVAAIDEGVQKSSPAIMSSGLVMAFSFLSLQYSDISIVRQFGLVTFITILMDIFVVRTIIVPAILIYFHRSEIEE